MSQGQKEIEKDVLSALNDNEKLKISELSNELSIPRENIRKACHTLEKRGWISLEPNWEYKLSHQISSPNFNINIGDYDGQNM